MKKAKLMMVLCCIAVLLLLVAGCAGDKPCEHEYGEWTQKTAPTCTAAGVEARTCSKCKEAEERAVDAKGHSFGAWNVTKSATCTAAGTETSTCNNCGEKQEREVAKLAHTYGEWNTVQASTCSVAGKKERACTGCGAKEEAALELAAHKYGSWKTVQTATCTTDGSKTQTCSTCGDTKTEQVKATGHDWKAANCTTPKTCKNCKLTEGSTSDHNYSEATCTKAPTCSGCGKTQGNALGHTAGSDGNCVRCGKTMVQLSSVLSKPMDSMNEIRSFVDYYYAKECYSAGNFRFIFNTANGVILSWGATNTSDKEIKYITFTVEYYNKVGDPAYDSITGKSSCTKRLTGPIGAGKSFYIRSLIGYGGDIYYGKITNVKIEYMDGTTLSGNYGYTTWHNIRTGASPKECVIIED